MMNENGILIEPLRLIYWYIPKCACTSLKAFFGRFLGLEFTNPHAAPFRVISPRQAAEYASWDSFAVVRHPLDRLVSLYRDKIRPGYRGWGFPAGVEEFVFGKYGDLFREDMTFTQFACACMAIPDPDPHFASQVALLRDETGIVAEEVFALEEMSELTGYLRTFGLNAADLQHENPSRRTMPWENKYSPVLRACAEAYYADDLKLLGYD